MSTNEFDRLIAKKVSQVEYEYDTNDWENLTKQLAATRRKKRAMVIAYLSSGIAASVVIFIISIGFMHSKKEIPAIQYTANHQTLSPAQLTQSTRKGIDKQPVTTLTNKQYASSTAIVGEKRKHPESNTNIGTVASIADNKPAADTTTQQPATKEMGTFDPAQKDQENNNEKITSLGYAEIENKPVNRGVNISLAGGVNYGTVNMGYAVGAIADKKLSNKIGVEVTVAYIGNTNLLSNATSQGISSSPPVYVPTKPTQVVNSTLNYLQCASMADYSLTQKISLGAGADLQRLLQEHSVNVFYNQDSKVVPLIDVGMLLRVEYSISSRLKTGVSYRLGANNIISSGNNYIDRNYTQIQLKYKLH